MVCFEHNFIPQYVVIHAYPFSERKKGFQEIRCAKTKGAMNFDVLNGKIYKMIKDSGRSGLPKIVVVIPFYNEMHKLVRSIDSLVSQTMKPSLVILVDDCGNEPLLTSIPETLTEAGIQCVTIRNPQNLGPGGSRQTGLSTCPSDTDFLIFLDSDDFLSDDFVRESVRTHQLRPDIIATYANTINILNGHNRIDLTPDKYDHLVDGILNMRKWGTGALMWKYNQIRDLKWEKMRCVEDSHFELSAALINPTIEYVDAATLYIEQSFEEDRLIRRNRLVKEHEMALRHKLYNILLNEYPFETEVAIKKKYLKRAVHHWIRYAEISMTDYLLNVLHFIKKGRPRISLQMIVYTPLFIKQLGRLKKQV
jgi:glycosyltransferase involved in cell wall biosynthesis